LVYSSPVQEEEEYLNSEFFKEDKQFWESVFEEPPPSAPMLPFDFPREQGKISNYKKPKYKKVTTTNKITHMV
jgi:hypothetical protein